MPIMIQIDASNNTAAGVTAAVTSLGTLSAQLDKVGAAGLRAEAGIGQIGTRADANASGVERLAKSLQSMNSGLRGSSRAVDQYIGAMAALDRSSSLGTKGFDTLVQSTYRLNTSLGDSMLVMDSFITKLGEMQAAALLTATSIRSIGTMRVASDAGVALGGGGSSGGGYFNTSAARLGPLGVYGNGAVSLGGSRLGSSVLGGLGMPTILAGAATIAAGVYATIQASKFWSAVAQTTAQSGGTVGPGSNALGQSILNYAASGKSPYRATVEAQGIEPLLAHGISSAAIKQALPSIAQVSALNQAPNLDNAVSLINTLVAPYGSKATGAQLTHAADWSAKLETMTSILPGLVTKSVPTMLGKIAGTGVTDSEAAGMLVKVGMQNPSARLDATSISRMVQDIALKPTAGAQKTANALGVGIGPGAVQAYGGIYNYLGALQTALTGDKNGARDASRIFTQTNALSAYKVLTMGGGLGQAAGYTDKLGNVDGTANNAFNQYSQGTQQQGAQLMNRLNADFISLGTVLETSVLPHLIDFGNALLKGGEDFARLINPGNPKGQRSTGFFPAAGNAVDVGLSWLTGYNGPGTAPTASTQSAIQRSIYNARSMTARANGIAMPSFKDWESGQAQVPASTPAASLSLAALLLNPSHAIAAHVSTLLGRGTGPVNSRGMNPHGAFFAAIEPRYGAAVTGSAGNPYAVAGGVAAGTRATGYRIQDFLNQSNQPVPESVHKTIQDDRSTINALISMGANAGQVSNALTKLKQDLGRSGSGYSAQSTSNISGTESAKVAAYVLSIRANTQAGVVGADQDNLALAQALGATPQKLKAIFDQYIVDQRALIILETKPGTARTLALNSLNKQGIIGDAGYNNAGSDRAIKDAQNQAAIDKNIGNFGAYVRDLKTAFALQSKQPGQDASDIALLKSNMLLAIGALNPKTNIHPFYQQNPGVGGLIAGINSTAVRVGGGKDPQSEAIKELTKELAAANARYENLLREIANNTARDRPAANKPLSIMGGQRSASS